MRRPLSFCLPSWRLPFGLSLLFGLSLAVSVRSSDGTPAPLAWKRCLGQPKAWFASDQALRIADNVLLYQLSSGGWPKNTDMARPLTDEEKANLRRQKVKTDSTIDNGATTRPMAYLAKVFQARPEVRFRDGFLRGLDYLFEAQYPNGGWPQFYPKRSGYYARITFNDSAMVNVLRLLRTVADRESLYAFVDENRRRRAAQSVASGVDCILRCQVVVDGRKTVWCAQHDETTLVPASARSYEKVSLSGSESVGIVRFLMEFRHPSPAIVDAIQSAVRWFETARLQGIRQVNQPASDLPKGYDKIVVSDPQAPPLWARFYEIGSNRPIFCGRDGIVKYRLAEIEHERRVGYAWYTSAPARLLASEYPSWNRDMERRLESVAASPYARWSHGPPSTPEFFPIGVWLQNPAKADRYRRAGFNTYVGLWKGPTADQLRKLRDSGMKVVCHQNSLALERLDDPTIIGWMHGDEPDNAQRRADGEGYGPPIPPATIVADYSGILEKDKTRPVLLNLGQGVAWDGWKGRGVRTNHPEDYAEYVKGCDIASFDIYPAVHSSPEVAGKLTFVARGVERLRGWTREDQVVWNCIECTRIQHPSRKATPAQVEAEVWMSIIHGSMGLIYFVHEWEPRFNESALLDDPEMLAAVTKINRQITKLAPVLNSPTFEPGAVARTQASDGWIAKLVKRHEGAVYLFAVNMRNAPSTTTFRIVGSTESTGAEVLGENRVVPVNDGVFQDRFGPWAVHRYRLEPSE